MLHLIAQANSIKYHESRLNASLSVSYKAEVPLDPDQFKRTNAKDFNFEEWGLTKGENYPVDCFRTYNIILDGKLRTSKLIVSKLSRKSKDELASVLTLREDRKYILDLSELPVINKSYLSTTSANSLAQDCWKAFILNSELSVLRYLKKAFPSEALKDAEHHGGTYLAESFYITRNSYQPPKVQSQVSDSYMAYEFNVSFKGYTKPSVSSVVSKIEANKSLTPRERIIGEFYKAYKDAALEDVNSMYDSINLRLSELSRRIQSSKLAIVLINRCSMDEFQDRSAMTLDLNFSDLDGINVAEDKVSVSFDIKQVVVEI